MKKQLNTVLLLIASTVAVTAHGQADSTEYKTLRFGGYGEILFQRMNYGADRYKDPAGAPREKRAYISIPRTILSFDYKFTPSLVLGTEVEFEYGGTGSALEVEYDEAGEYEMEVEKGGEVVLEQFHLTKRFAPWLNLRAGHVIVPVGLTNAHHEPIFFFGTVRPEGETTILPSTWHETGVSLMGRVGGGLNYEVMMINGLDPNGFSSANWIQGGKQGLFEKSVMTSPAFAGRLEYTPVRGLRVGVSGYYNRTARNASIPQKTADIAAKVSIATADVQYQNRNLVVRANFVYGHLTDAMRLSQINKNISKNTQFARTPVASDAMTYAVEAGYNVMSVFGSRQRIIPFARYEYYNSAEKVPAEMSAMPINKRDLFTAGANYQIAPGLLLKADYSVRRLDRGRYNNENTFGLALAYTGWFFQK
jgi:hypothetical protein